jgi:hypothetical protein
MTSTAWPGATTLSSMHVAIGQARTIIFADFYHHIISILQNPNSFGNDLKKYSPRTRIVAVIWTMF